MAIINRLDPQLTNMIAAGEVVERPQGIVKELVENSIDAGAKSIDVSVTQGGIESITVTDDGKGMDPTDATMAFERHATSKIHKQNDLWNIHTLGFRGEALPSIASVSKVDLETSDGDTGTKVVIEYGKRMSAMPYPSNQGTSICVKGVFLKTPARLKHLKSVAYENSLISDVIMKFALSHPDIAFRFVSDGKESFKTNGNNDLLEVIYTIYGKEVAQNAMAVDIADYDYTIKGYLVKPVITRASRNAMNVFLNGRMVRPYRIMKAITDAYSDYMVKDRYPLVVLDIKMDSQLVDVNVHPSKWEVRLSKEQQLEHLLKEKLPEVIRSYVLIPEVNVQSVKDTRYEPITFEDLHIIHPRKEENSNPTSLREEVPQTITPKETGIQKETEIQEEVKEVVQSAPVRKFPVLNVIGQLHGKYIVCECAEGLAIIDQHAAQERVHYEEIQASIHSTTVMMDQLVPVTIKASADVVNRVDELNEALSDFQLTFEAFGSDTLIIRSLPSWMKDIEETKFLQDLVEYFKEDREVKYTHLEWKKIATMACHHSIRFNRFLTEEEMKEVVLQLSTCENPYHCPHGRPTFIILNEAQFEREFLR